MPNVSLSVLKKMLAAAPDGYSITHTIGQDGEPTVIDAADLDVLESGTVNLVDKETSEVAASCAIKPKKAKAEREYTGDTAKALERTVENALAFSERLIIRQEKQLAECKTEIEKLREERDTARMSANEIEPSTAVQLVTLALQNPDAVMPLITQGLQAFQSILQIAAATVSEKKELS